MLTGTTWVQFLEGIALLLIAYYIVVGLLYFKKEMRALLQRKKSNTVRVNEENIPQSSQDPLMPSLHALMTGIKTLLQAAASEKYAANETILGLQQLIREYPAIKVSRFVPSINNEIIQLSNELLGQPLSADDMDVIWN